MSVQADTFPLLQGVLAYLSQHIPQQSINKYFFNVPPRCLDELLLVQTPGDVNCLEHTLNHESLLPSSGMIEELQHKITF